jgi:hypothetical protein
MVKKKTWRWDLALGPIVKGRERSIAGILHGTAVIRR